MLHYENLSKIKSKIILSFILTIIYFTLFPTVIIITDKLWGRDVSVKTIIVRYGVSLLTAALLLLYGFFISESKKIKLEKRIIYITAKNNFLTQWLQYSLSGLLCLGIPISLHFFCIIILMFYGRTIEVGITGLICKFCIIWWCSIIIFSGVSCFFKRILKRIKDTLNEGVL